uniref:F5/8 type C domain-containing protein n=1 Tax=Haptolina brevifila TaxID=156173 RepID=A0A7S2G3S8_9EUKA|mmetsp:Transcript_26137/g.52408  ORF Transcript_26137/g.52408 Transcript_26137/m.52408 type:complete len:280 (+) Transcript_26137:2-841(+)
MTSESSVLTNPQAGFWGAYKEAPNKQRGWLQLDAGRKVKLLGWKLQVQSPCSQAHEGSYLLSVSDDGQTWHQVPKQATWKEFDRRVMPLLAGWGTPGGMPAAYWNDQVAPILREAHLEITHKDQVYSAQECIATARYFRLTPQANIAQDAKQIRFGLIILDDGGEHTVGPRRVRDLSPLHIAAKAGDTEMMAKLLHHGADPEMLAGIWKPFADKDFSRGWTALQLAATAASLEAVQMLVDRGAKVHEDQFEVPMGKAGDLVAGFLQTNGSKPVTRTAAN